MYILYVWVVVGSYTDVFVYLRVSSGCTEIEKKNCVKDNKLDLYFKLISVRMNPGILVAARFTSVPMLLPTIQ